MVYDWRFHFRDNGVKWLVTLNFGKIISVSFDRSILTLNDISLGLKRIYSYDARAAIP